VAAGRCSFCGRRDTEVPTLVAGPGGVAICPECAELAIQISRERTDPRFDGDLLVIGIGRLVTNDPVGDDLIGEVPDAAVAVRDGKVAWAGPAAALPYRYRDLPELDCEGRAVIPGFVDSHTHLVFAGERSIEFGRRRRGERYEDIAAAGGGIRSTVAATRQAGPDSLMEDAIARAGRMLAAGTTTVEVKSGYGLEPLTEVHLLEVANEIGERLPIDVVPTFLGAHAIPEEFEDLRQAYLWTVTQEMLPVCAPLARFCDVFCDRGAFDQDEARRVLQAGVKHGLRPRLHAGQLEDVGAIELAVELRAASADHLDHCTREQAALLAESRVAAVLLPAASLSLGTMPPARMLWDEGATVALATDCNPGTSFVERMPFVVALGVLELGLSPEEALWAATRGGSLALELPDRGRLGPGALADIVVLDADSHLHLSYRPDADHTWKVVKRGVVVSG
jgi:imidazolonepropionase